MAEQLRIPQIGEMAPTRIEARAEIQRMWRHGYTDTAIARSLNARAVPTGSGRGRWYPATVRRFADPTAREHWRQYIARRRARERGA